MRVLQRYTQQISSAEGVSSFPAESCQEEILLLLRATVLEGGKILMRLCRKACHKIEVLKITKVIIQSRTLIKEF